MLVVNPEARFTIDQCLAHPWMTTSAPAVNDSTDGLVGGLAGLDVHRRGAVRERTLLSSINTIEVTKVQAGQHSVKVFSKNPRSVPTESRPADNRQAREFVEMGGKGDPTLFGNETSHYSKNDVAATKKGKGKKK